jgi:cell wall-associated NlpC family hydrolase
MPRKDVIEVPYLDLVHLPYKRGGTTMEGLDCRGVTLIVLQRMGRTVPPGAFPATLDQMLSDCGSIAARADVEEVVDPRAPWAKHWKRVRLASANVGDVAFCYDGEEAHVAPLLSKPKHGRPSYVLSATREHGVVVVPTAKLKNLIGFYALVP